MLTILNKSRTWCAVDGLTEEQRNAFQFNNADSLESTNYLIGTNEITSTEPVYNYQGALILSIRNEMKRISEFIPLPFVIFLTDKTGRILDVVSSAESLRDEMEQAGFSAGLSLAKQSAGLNAVSLAMEMNCIGVVQGDEHSDPTFKHWNCVCAPLYLDGIVQGYVDISFHKQQPIEFAIPFIQQVSENVTGKWMNQNAEVQQHRIVTKFQEYNLTAREKDVAYQWFLEKSALYISNELDICEGTVRNIVKSIYTKMNVNDRRQFTKKLTS
ncbi:LuxR C-terminal-related transcriptional regulator [Paenibacillus sp. sgz500958]|uniref:helix-turn-helix domain-containing protein n=1 Tax=Paenibacillus sp. sgz500958 TaxID=3242475 RepID=UPI0036D26F3F